MRGLSRIRLTSRLAVMAVIVVVTAPFIGSTVLAQPASTGPARGNSVLAASSPEGMYAYYYLWWDTHHWQTTLGPSYPFGQSPLPVPATLDANGCNPSSLYRATSKPMHRPACSPWTTRPR